MKKIVLLTFVFLLLSTAVVVRFANPVVAEETIYIRADGSVEGTDKIQCDGNVYTFTGNIYGSIVVERDNIVVDGAGYTLQGTGMLLGTGIALTDRSNVIIRNMQIRYFGNGISIRQSSNNTIAESTVTNNGHGINLLKSSNNIITENNITSHDIGIVLGYSSNNRIVGNRITANNQAILLYASSYNSIIGNNITKNRSGIWCESTNPASNYNSIVGNNITHNAEEGILLRSTSNNRIEENNISNNKCGISLDFCSNSTFYHNNFINNTQQALIYTYGCYANYWDDGYPSGGNYWSDYEDRYPNATELNGSGIWGTPYVIDEDNQDNYPLMHIRIPPLETTPPTISIVSPENKTYTVNDVSLTFTVSEPTSWIGYSLYSQANVTISGNTTLTGLSDGSHSLTVYATDKYGNTGASETIYFTISQQSASFPTTWIVAAIAIIAIVGAAPLVYFRKNKKKPRKTEK